MSDVPSTTKASRQKQSERIRLDAAGNPQDDYLGAAGFKYVSVAEKFGVTAMKATTPPEIWDGWAVFGGLTMAGNVTNTVRNGENKDGGPQTESEALRAWIDNVMLGNWTGPRGEVEAGVDALAAAYVRAMAEEGHELDLDETKDKIRAKDSAGRSTLRKHPKVALALKAIAYEAAQARAASDAGELPAL